MKIIFIITTLFMGSVVYANGKCEILESISSSGGYRILQIDKIKLDDVVSFKELDNKIFYATSPIYGKSEIGLIDCKNHSRAQIVAPQNLNKAYPDGADFFRIKEVSKEKNNSYKISYFYIADVDSKDFKNLENQKNLKTVVYSIKK